MLVTRLTIPVVHLDASAIHCHRVHAAEAR